MFEHPEKKRKKGFGIRTESDFDLKCRSGFRSGFKIVNSFGNRLLFWAFEK